MSKYNINSNTIAYVITIAVSGLLAWSVAFGSMRAHTVNKTVHTTYKEQTEYFMPRETLTIQFENINRLLVTVQEDITYIRSNIKVK